ncbi:MAG TPA: response regulator, partial [Anaerolineaceae bacterium]|nr:response regulator [Anaerolineaceae bacterium]
MRDNRPLRIWLIDDKPDDRRLARRAIERYFTHAEVQEIGTLDDWQRALTSPLPNLVITDHRLHWGDGLQVLQTIKSRDPLCPVIMFTNTATEQIVLDAFRQGLDDYLLKAPQHFPLIPITLVNTLKRARQQRAIHQAEARLRLLHEINR